MIELECLLLNWSTVMMSSNWSRILSANCIICVCGSQADGMDGRRAIFFESNNASGNAQTANSKTINFSRPTGIERSGDEERERVQVGVRAIETDLHAWQRLHHLSVFIQIQMNNAASRRVRVAYKRWTLTSIRRTAINSQVWACITI